jgi:hypothetical protein
VNTSRIRVALTAAALAFSAACSADGGPMEPPPPAESPALEPGVLTLRLATPHADDGALLLTLVGPGPITEVAAAAGSAYVVHSRAVDGVTRIAVFGAVAAGDLVRFTVPDVNRAASYSAALLELSDRASALRASTDGYALTVVR